MDAECGVGDIGCMQRTSADADVRGMLLLLHVVERSGVGSGIEALGLVPEQVVALCQISSECRVGEIGSRLRLLVFNKRLSHKSCCA
eukprot:08022_4